MGSFYALAITLLYEFMIKYLWCVSIKVLTLKQLWETLVAEGIKKYEFRLWKTNYRGKILIHVGTGIDKKALENLKI